MRSAASAALVLAALCACAPAPTHIVVDPDAGGHPIGQGGGGGGGGDGGADAGDGGPDAGDAGCAPLTLAGVAVVDGCHSNNPTTATGSVNPANCSIDINIPGFIGPCSGTVSGASDAFDGGCQSGFYTCTSLSLPGTLNCTYAGTSCQVRICDAGTCP